MIDGPFTKSQRQRITVGDDTKRNALQVNAETTERIDNGQRFKFEAVISGFGARCSFRKI